MSSNNLECRQKVQQTLNAFATLPLPRAAIQLLDALGYSSDKTADLGTDAGAFLAGIETFRADLGPINRDKVKALQWQSCAFLFQLTNDEIPSLAIGQTPLGADNKLARGQIESFVFLAIELKSEDWSRTQLATISREMNKRFPMPAILLFKHGSLLSLAVIDRRQNLRDASRDVIDSRITVIKDVRCQAPHRAHIDILASLALENLGERRRPSNFRELYDAWIEALSTQALNKRFYTELAWWYFWAVKQVDFPQGGGADAAKRNAVAVIRLLTRLIFIWFIKEKSLVPEALFERGAVQGLLKADPSAFGEDSNYYLAILQNLFFATLNVEMGADRKWAQDGGGMKGDRLIHSLYRHKELFKDPDAAFDLFAQIPFLNGGLFECLDRDLTERDFQRNPELKSLAVKEGNGWVLRVDGFSRRRDAQPAVPNKIFFGGETGVDLNSDLGTKGKRYDVQGVLDLIARYKFTVDENTPLEEEVALDPELLGKVFENLLASYNEDTQSTARKQSGSFYTPREVVDYMVDEALIAYFERHLPPSPATGRRTGDEGACPVNEFLDLGAGPGELDLPVIPAQAGIQSSTIAKDGGTNETRLRLLLSYTAEGDPFDADETAKLIAAIERLNILDPACGSGAFPMGILNKLVHVLRKLDPGNELWKAQNRAPMAAQLAEARKILDIDLRQAKEEEAEAALVKFDRDFADDRHADYTRKLYLIEKCIHGVDIQPIAVQIAKLRFFIALVVSQQALPPSPAGEGNNRGITPLPNLETKIVAADSLIPIERPAQMGLRDPAIDQKEKELAAANEYYFAARTAKTKRRWRDRIYELRDELAALLEEDRFLSPGAARQLVHWNPFDQNAAADFFDPEWMFQLAEGFDITIGNPPYVRHEDISHLSPVLKKHYECAASRADLYVFFYERAIRLLKPEGAFAFITSNKWYRAKYGEKLRDWMNRCTRLRQIIDFGDEAVFTALAYPTIVVATRRKLEVKQPTVADQVRILNWEQQGPVETFPAVFANESFVVPQAELQKEGWQLEQPGKKKLLLHILASGRPLGDFVNGHFYRGVTTGFNDAFVIDEGARSKLISADKSSAELIKPYIRGRDITRWKAEWAGLYLIAFPFGFHEKLKEYPAVLEHLFQFEGPLRMRGQCTSSRNGKSEGQHHWLELDNNPKESYFAALERPKIISTKVSMQPTFAFDTSGAYLANTAYFIAVGELGGYLLPLLNSSISGFYAKSVFVGKQNGWYEVQPAALEAFPVPDANKLQKEIIEVLGAIATAYSEPRFEQLINGLAFELFFPDNLHAANIHLFDACDQAGLGKLSTLKDKALVTAANELATTIFAPSHPLYAMLFDLQGLDVVRIIEGRE